jgi:hypothetical protein
MSQIRKVWRLAARRDDWLTFACAHKDALWVGGLLSKIEGRFKTKDVVGRFLRE